MSALDNSCLLYFNGFMLAAWDFWCLY